MNTMTTPGSSTTVKPILEKYYVRAMAPSDVRHAENLERTSRETYWGAEDFRCVLREPGMQGRLVTHEGRIIGHYLFQLLDDEVVLWNLTVDPEYRRRKIGSTVLQNLIRDHVDGRRAKLSCHVRDSNLAAHLFLRANKLRALSVEKAYFKDETIHGLNHEDAYHFVTLECSGV